MDGSCVAVGLMILVGFVGTAVPVLPDCSLWSGEPFSSYGHRWSRSRLAGWSWASLRPWPLPVSCSSTSFPVVGCARPGSRDLDHPWPRGALAVVGFFVIPVVGAFLGFARSPDRAIAGAHPVAWRSTKHALKAIGLSMGIELLTALAIAGTWVIGVVATT